MAFELDDDVARKITKLTLIGYVFMFFVSPVQPLLGSTMMGLAAIVLVLLGPNPLRILGLMGFALAGYLFWPEYQESKKLPTRLAVREALKISDPAKAAVAAFHARNGRLPRTGELGLSQIQNDKAVLDLLPSGAMQVRLKVLPLQDRVVRQIPLVNGSQLSWQCVSDDVEQSYLPAQCRNTENLRRAAAQKAAQSK